MLTCCCCCCVRVLMLMSCCFEMPNFIKFTQTKIFTTKYFSLRYRLIECYENPWKPRSTIKLNITNEFFFECRWENSCSLRTDILLFCPSQHRKRFPHRTAELIYPFSSLQHFHPLSLRTLLAEVLVSLFTWVEGYFVLTDSLPFCWDRRQRFCAAVSRREPQPHSLWTISQPWLAQTHIHPCSDSTAPQLNISPAVLMAHAASKRAPFYINSGWMGVISHAKLMEENSSCPLVR